MTVSAAKIEANRRNCLKSTGPRTSAGKDTSRFNAVKHGARAETLVLRGEDPQALEALREAWRACLLPGDDVEARLVDDAVMSTWQQDRAGEPKLPGSMPTSSMPESPRTRPMRSKSTTWAGGSSTIGSGR